MMLPRCLQKKTPKPAQQSDRVGKGEGVAGKNLDETLHTHPVSKPQQNDLCSVTQDVLTEIVDKCVNVAEDKRASSAKKSAEFTAITDKQCEVRIVKVGAVCRSSKVPVYERRRKPRADKSSSMAHVFQRLCWQPQPSTRASSPMLQDYCGRRWEFTEPGEWYLQRPVQHQGFVFTVMSYNILAQDLLEQHIDMYYGPRRVLDWPHRRARLLSELKLHMPDVICLQEVQCDHYGDFLLPQLQALGYDGIYLKRTGDKSDGCATLYKTSKFNLHQVIQVPYLHKYGSTLLDRDNVGLIVQLKPLSDAVSQHKLLTVANTHLLFNPKRGDVKLGQLMMLLAEIDACSYLNEGRHQYQPVIMCGDFNSKPHSDIYKLVIMGQLEYEGLLCHTISGQTDVYGLSREVSLTRDFFPRSVGITDTCQYSRVVQSRKQEANKYNSPDNCEAQGTGLLQHQLRFVSAYTHWTKRGWRYYPEVSTHHGRSACNVDYIFYGVQTGLVRFHRGEVQTRDVQEGHLNLLARYSLLTERELDRMGSLPNTHFGSDHLGLIAMFLLT